MSCLPFGVQMALFPVQVQPPSPSAYSQYEE